MTARHFTQTYCTLEKLFKTPSIFPKSLWIKISFSEIIATVSLKENRIHKTVTHPMETACFALQQTQMYLTRYTLLSHTLYVMHI